MKRLGLQASPAAASGSGTAYAPPRQKFDFDPRVEVCKACGTSDARLSRCSRCEAVYYCSVECQHAHWKAGHKRECKPKVAAESTSAE